MKKKDLILEIYKDKRTVFTLRDIALLTEESNYLRLRQKINYYVRNNSIANIRRGIYVKENFDPEELACRIYTPSYISLDYVLRKAGVIFQYDERLTQVSYLSRSIEAGNYKFVFSKIRGDILLNISGIVRKERGINIAATERALLDMLYLNKEFHFDYVSDIDRELIKKILPVYQSERFSKRAAEILNL